METYYERKSREIKEFTIQSEQWIDDFAAFFKSKIDEGYQSMEIGSVIDPCFSSLKRIGYNRVYPNGTVNEILVGIDNFYNKIIIVERQKNRNYTLSQSYKSFIVNKSVRDVFIETDSN